MANNRLYIVDTESGDYACIAKTFDKGWGFGNADILNELLENCFEYTDKTRLILVTENDDELYDKYIRNGYNLNIENKWEYYK